MFRKAKKDMELFPDPTDTYVDPRSLSNRIIRNKQVTTACMKLTCIH